MVKKAEAKSPKQKQSLIRRIGLWALATLAAFVLVSAGLMWRYDQWHKSDPEVIGVSFSQVQAERYGVNWKANYTALLDDLSVKHLRLAAYWDRIEPGPDRYDFSETDWMLEEAAKRGAKVKLVIGQKLIRYPECFYPGWLDRNNPDEVETRANKMLRVVVERYKDSTAIESWQLENEFLLHTFGECPASNLTNAKLAHELKTVQSIDTTHPIILTQSNQYGFPALGPNTDYYGFSMYRKVWNNVSGYFTYPQRGVFNWWKAAVTESYRPTTVTIHELQGEAWGPKGNEHLSWDEAQVSMNPDQLADNVAYARETHIKQFDLWGSEWWYWLKNTQNHPEMWDAARQYYGK